MKNKSLVDPKGLVVIKGGGFSAVKVPHTSRHVSPSVYEIPISLRKKKKNKNDYK